MRRPMMRFQSILWLCLMLVTMAADGHAETFVLVHGAFQNASCWDPVVTRLHRAGHTVVAVQLPGRDNDGLAPATVTLEAYCETVRKAIEAQAEPVVLVGHSFGGITISAVAERMPQRVKRLVYVAAYLPRSGESLQSLSAEDHDNRFTKENFAIAPDYSTAQVLERDRASIFANDAKPEVAARIAQSMIPEPLPPMGTTVTLTSERFGQVPKVYIHTRRDHAVSPVLQRMMVERTPVAATFTLDSGHSPYVTQPARLAKLLIRAAR